MSDNDGSDMIGDDTPLEQLAADWVRDEPWLVGKLEEVARAAGAECEYCPLCYPDKITGAAAILDEFTKMRKIIKDLVVANKELHADVERLCGANDEI